MIVSLLKDNRNFERSETSTTNQKKWMAISIFVLISPCVLGMRTRGHPVALREPQKTSNNSKGFVAISAGWSHTLALKSDGRIVGWGDNRWGMADPPGGNGFVAIAAGTYFSLALKSDGSIVGFGRESPD